MCCYNSFGYGYTSSACSNSAQDFSVSLNVHSTFLTNCTKLQKMLKIDLKMAKIAKLGKMSLVV